jgi:hypothetical protein
MNPTFGWALAVAALVVGWLVWGWRGMVLALTLTAFWLVLQFNRALRVMKNAAAAPVGQVPSAVMLNARLSTSMTMLQVVTLTRSLGRRIGDAPEVWSWADPGGAMVEVTLDGGRVARWQLKRPEGEAGAP